MQAEAIEALLKEARLQDALGIIQSNVRAEPARITHRILLFQVLSLLGQWERAATQLTTLEEMDRETLALSQAYRQAILCEAFRREVFAGTRTPLVLGDPVDWLAWLLEALRMNAAGHHAEARALRDRAFAAAPAVAGRLDGQGFAWIADADMRLGPVLEALMDGKYYWIPFDRLRGIVIEAPTDLRDLVWLPATLTFATGGENVALLPARYPGSEEVADDLVRMGRRTDWRDIGAETYVGLGQRMLTTDAGEFPLLDIRRIELDAGHG
ncbi:MAG: virulence protein SciE type [Thiobacillaceae bacterium]|jgi:type VI secretion system protein ImpE|nr:virulence protein SciE type [Thiobacillaceae bacterium]